MSGLERFGVDPDEPDPDERTLRGATLYVVATNYDGDPHPHVEGVFADESDADELMERCQSRVEDPRPVAWQKFEVEVE